MRKIEPERDRRPYWKRLADSLPWYGFVIVGAAVIMAPSRGRALDEMVGKGLGWLFLSGIAIGIAYGWHKLREWWKSRAGAQTDARFDEQE